MNEIMPELLIDPKHAPISPELPVWECEVRGLKGAIL
jgi:hypothetical protein